MDTNGSNRPGQEVTLPSLGKPYGSAIPEGLVTVYPMVTNDEKLFGALNKRLDIENVIDTLIRRCSSLPKTMKPEELYAGDRTYLWIMIRAASYGAMYPANVTCPECYSRWDHEINILKDLEIKEVDEAWQDPFEVELPICRDVVTLRLFRGSDERNIIQYVDRANKKLNIKQIGDPGYTYRMALHLVGVKSHDPSQSFDQDSLAERPGTFSSLAHPYIEKLAAQDSSVIREEIENRTPGIRLAIEMECPKCVHQWLLGLPIGPDFFRSKSASKSHLRTRVVPG